MRGQRVVRGRRRPPDVRATRGAGGAAVGVLHVSLWRSCAAQGGHVQLRGMRVGAWRGCREAETRGVRVPLRLWCRLVPPRNARGNPLCVCATQPGAGCGVSSL